MQKGATYRVLASWTTNSSAATDLVFRLTDFYHDSTPANNVDDGVVGFWPEDVILPGPNQRQATSDMLRFENGVFNGWKELHAGFTINSSPNSPGSLAIHFASSQAIHADAIRIERMASRSYQYDANGNLLKEIDPLDRATTYAYDELDRVITETLPDPDTAAPGSLSSPLTTTSYDGYGNVTSALEHRGGGANQRTTAFKYDRRNRRTEEIFDDGVATTNLNRKTVFDYDDVGNLEYRFEYAPNVANPSIFDLLRTTSYKHDKLDRQISETRNSDGIDNNASPGEQITTTSYDANGNVSQTVENAGLSGATLTTAFRYDALNRTAQEAASSSSQTRITRFQYDAAGQQIAALDPLLRISRSEFDRLGRLVKSTDPDPDGAGPLQSHATAFAYDSAGQLLLKNNGANQTPGAHEIDRYAYDPQGRLIRSENGRGDVTRRSYDDAGNLVKLIDPAGNVTTYAYDGLDRQISEATTSGTRTFTYDASGNLSSTVDRNNRNTRYTYNRDDQVKFEGWYASVNDPFASYVGTIETFYDNLGRLSEQQMFRKNAAGAFDYRATDSYVYDGLDRIIEHSNQSLKDPAGRYSATNGNVAIPALKQTYAYAYDSNGETVTREQFIAGAFAASTKSTYNAFGDLIRQEDKETSSAGAPSSILDFESTDAAFAYLADGSLASTTRYTDWDAALGGHRNRVKTTYAYDGAGRIQNIAHSQARRTTATWPGDTQLVDFDYEYDAASRIGEIYNNWNSNVTAFSSRVDIAQTFTYDGAGQLTGVSTGSGSAQSYSYSSNGNRTLANDSSSTPVAYSPGPQNQIAQDTVFSYIYDAEGNLLERRWLSGNQLNLRYTWDHRNRLAKLEQYDFLGVLNNTVQYRYNAADELIYRNSTVAGQEYYLVESGQRSMAFEADGDVKHRIQYGPTGDVLFDQVFNAVGTPTLQAEQDLQLLLGDHQHSVRVVVAHDANDAAYVQQSLSYTPFGQIGDLFDEDGGVPIDSPSIAASFGFQGMIYDDVVGQYRTQTRVYDSSLGRFISEDPIQDGSNWYAFAGNDPVNFADPSGLSQQGHPLGGAFSGNKTTAPSIKSGNIPANALSTIGTPLGHAVSRGHGTRSEPTPVSRPNSKPLTIHDFNLAKDPGFVSRVHSPQALPPSSGLNQVMDGYFKAYANNDAFQRAIDDIHANKQALYDINHGNWSQAGRGQLAMSLDHAAGNMLFPGFGVGEYQDAEMLFGRDSTKGQRAFAAGSLAISLITLGESPNASMARRGTATIDTHALQDIVPAQVYTHQIDVLPNTQVFSQIDAFAVFNPPRVNSAGQPINELGQFVSGAGGDSAAARAGRKAHADFNALTTAKPDWNSQPRIKDANGRIHIPDATSPSGRPVELKPDTASGIKSGRRQINRYNDVTGRNGTVLYYDPATGNIRFPFFDQ